MKVYQGIDIASVRRIRGLIRRQGEESLSRVFTPGERAYCDPKKRRFEHYAARFAAKEAFLKAVETCAKRRCDWLEIEVRHRPTGKPYFFFSAKTRKALGLTSRSLVELSITHEREYAMASVLVMAP